MEKVKKLKESFVKEKIDGYIIPKNDEFFGEYPPVHKDRLNFISNFSLLNCFLGCDSSLNIFSILNK